MLISSTSFSKGWACPIQSTGNPQGQICLLFVIDLLPFLPLIMKFAFFKDFGLFGICFKFNVQCFRDYAWFWLSQWIIYFFQYSFLLFLFILTSYTPLVICHFKNDIFIDFTISFSSFISTLLSESVSSFQYCYFLVLILPFQLHVYISVRHCIEFGCFLLLKNIGLNFVYLYSPTFQILYVNQLDFFNTIFREGGLI